MGTLLGTVAFRRHRLRCAGCGTERYSVDEALGLEAVRQGVEQAE